MNFNKIALFGLLLPLTVISCSGSKEASRPFYEGVWLSDNYTMKVYNSSGQLSASFKFNEKGANFGEYKTWFYSGFAFDVYQSSNKYYIYEEEMYKTYVNLMTVESFKTRYEFAQSFLNSSVKKVEGVSGVYVSAPKENGVDYLFRRFAYILFPNEDYHTVIAQYPNAAIRYTCEGKEVTGHMITNRADAGKSKYSYWASFKISDVGSTDLGFTPEIVYAELPTTQS